MTIDTNIPDANIESLGQDIDKANKIVIIQAENPDGDSLATSLAMEQILGDLGKEVVMYCPVAVAKHLRHLVGWDRVVNELPKNFDMSIILDTTSQSLMPRVFTDQQLPILRSRPMAAIDHHKAEDDLPFAATLAVDTECVSTGEVVYRLAARYNWPINEQSAQMIVSSIMYDSLGLTTPLTTAKSIHTVANLVENYGVKLYELDARRRAMSKKPQEIVSLKGRLLQRIEYASDGQLATIDITWSEIEAYSDKYNPSVLVLDDMRMTEGVKVAVAYKSYPSGRVTAKIRSNLEAPIASQIAEHFGSGGHDHAAGFKINKAESLESVKAEVVSISTKLLNNL